MAEIFYLLTKYEATRNYGLAKIKPFGLQLLTDNRIITALRRAVNLSAINLPDALGLIQSKGRASPVINCQLLWLNRRCDRNK